MSSSWIARWCALALAPACSTSFTPQPCAIDGECGAGLVCEQRDQQPVCVHAADAPLVIGQSAPVTGTNQALGIGMKLGIELAFNEKNAAGGVRGRQLVLRFADDQYTPDLAEKKTMDLLDAQVSKTDVPKCPSTNMSLAGNAPVSSTALTRGPNAVLAILGDVGTPTMLRSAPVSIETGTVYFGAFTGAATLLREVPSGGTTPSAGSCWRYIFNVRASYGQEAQATIEYFRKKGITSYKNLISFDQNDAFGQAGYDGLVNAYKNTIGPFPTNLPDASTPIFRQRYTRNDDTSVPNTVIATEAQLTALLAADATSPLNIGILMTDTYGAGGDFIQGLRSWQLDGGAPAGKTRLKLYFSNVSFVGANALSDKLKAFGKVDGSAENYTDNVVISQVVPNYQNDQSPVVTAYNSLIAKNSATPSFTSLEGYVAARVFIAGLDAHTGPFTASSLVSAFEALPDLGLGVGATSGFSPTSHQYSNSVWGTILQPDGSFKSLYFWSAGSPIMFFE
jgi:ABC-type branched-subunit amino acid transport system substrate-binding protein